MAKKKINNPGRPKRSDNIKRTKKTIELPENLWLLVDHYRIAEGFNTRTDALIEILLNHFENYDLPPISTPPNQNLQKRLKSLIKN